MANTVSYRLYINDKLRKFLGINLKHKKIYLFKLQHITYLSTDVIPKTAKVKILKVKLGSTFWYLDIPQQYVEYTPTTYTLLNTFGKVLKLLP